MFFGKFDTMEIHTIQQLLESTQLEQIEDNIFRGESHNVGSPSIFGGQILSQALDAAMQTVPDDRVAHSFHGYFILPGDWSKPVVFEVERIRNGGSFSTRRIVAIQNGRAIFNSSASFQIRQKGFEHQMEMPKNVPPPEDLPNSLNIIKDYGKYIPDQTRKFLAIPRPLEFRPERMLDYFAKESLAPSRNVWVKTKGKLDTDDINLHQKILAYASDYNLLTTAIMPHQDRTSFAKLQMASLDHAMWFHQDFRVDEWLLYVVDSPNAHNARGFTRGSFFTQDGRLVASVAQEGLMRTFQPKPK